MPSETPNIDYLLSEVTMLKILLEDPHPGLISWVDMYFLRMKNINDFWNGKKREEPSSAQ